MRVDLKGIAKVKKTLADGSAREYHYAWRGGPLLCDANGRPLRPNDAGFARAYKKAHEDHRVSPARNLKGLLVEFQASSDFTSKSAATQRAYQRYLAAIGDEFGTLAKTKLVRNASMDASSQTLVRRCDANDQPCL